MSISSARQCSGVHVQLTLATKSPVIRANEAIPVIQHHAIQVLILSVEAHLNVASELRVALWAVGFLYLVPQQTGHAFHLDLLFPDKDLQHLPAELVAPGMHTYAGKHPMEQNIQALVIHFK